MTDAESNDVLVVERRWDHVKFARGVDQREKLLVEAVGAFEAEADQPHLVEENTSLDSI